MNIMDVKLGDVYSLESKSETRQFRTGRMKMKVVPAQQNFDDRKVEYCLNIFTIFPLCYLLIFLFKRSLL